MPIHGHTFRDGLLKCRDPLTPVSAPLIDALAGVMGEGRPLDDPIFLNLIPGEPSGPSLLGAGVRLLLGPLVSSLIVLVEPLTMGSRSEAGSGAFAAFFWKNPMIVC